MLDTGDADFEERFASLLAMKREVSAEVDAVVAAILDDVAGRGDAALADYTRRFDEIALGFGGSDPGGEPEAFAEAGILPVRVAPREIAEAEAKVPAPTMEALRLAHERIRSHHERQRPANDRYVDPLGVELGTRWTAIEAVGLYVPGGTASYPSSVLMNAVPAKVAGCRRIVMCVPAPRGVINPLVLAAAGLAGVDEIYRLGGAQAVGAMAYGTETIAPVAKIVGPGNAYVAAAKRRVYGRVGIDMVAGPSEVLVVADGANDPDWIAADLLAQAEHDAAAQSILITDDAAFGRAVADAVERQLRALAREETARTSWERLGAIVVAADLEAAIPLVDRIAPEHLELALDDPEAFLERVTNAGAVFLGRHTPEAIGDYVGGSNHVLPTARSARYASGLGTLDFMKRTSVLRCGPGQLAALAPAAIALAEAEGLDAHARSVSIRTNAAHARAPASPRDRAGARA